MRIEFRQGVPKACIDWLWHNVGSGNVIHSAVGNNIRREILDTDVWYYERVAIPIVPEAFGDDPFAYVPTITVKDSKLATLFALRWS